MRRVVRSGASAQHQKGEETEDPCVEYAAEPQSDVPDIYPSITKGFHDRRGGHA